MMKKEDEWRRPVILKKTKRQTHDCNSWLVQSRESVDNKTCWDHVEFAVQYICFQQRSRSYA